jgi:hypothetical protein
MPRRYDESCLSVYVYKLNTQTTALFATEDQLRESLKLNVVTKVGMDTEIVYDEGDTRPIRKDIFLTLEAIITQNKDSEFGDSWEYGNETTPGDIARIRPQYGNQQGPSGWERGGNPINNKFVDTAAMITFFNEFLSTPGLVVDLSHYPSEVTSIVPSRSVNNDSMTSQFTAKVTQGLLVDSFNGPKPLSINIKPLPGGNDFQLTWKVKFSVSTAAGKNYAYEGVNVDISSELRLDIDQDGDLQVIVAGTIYAPNPAVLYKAREVLTIITTPMEKEFRNEDLKQINPSLIPPDNTKEFTNLFAQVNGFTRDVTFNIEKSGRSAKFSITYKQIKSNSALPLGIRTMDFDHEIQSSLFGESIFEGAGFTTWKSTFTGKMKIPHRFNANYAWFVIFYLIAQKTRKLGKFASKDKPPVSSDLAGLFNDAKGEPDPDKILTNIKGIPTFMRLKHKHFAREVEFTIEYLVIAPLHYVIAATCLFERVNNDYYKRFTLPKNEDGSLSSDYKPAKLSQQWLDWTATMMTENAFDPTSATGQNPFRSSARFSDNAGTQIVDTGHEINPFVRKGGIGNSDQKFLLVSQVIDPNEEDPEYADTVNTFYPLPNPNGYIKVTGTGIGGGLPDIADGGSSESFASLEDINPENYNNFNRKQSGQNYPAGTTNNAVALASLSESMDPRFSWIKFEESYEILVTHPTIPTESLTNVDYRAHSEPELYRDFINSAEYPSVSDPAGTQNIPDLAAETRHVFGSGLRKAETNVSPPPEPIVNQNNVVRKTYAAKASRYYVTVKGMALRIKYPISIPTVISIAGAPAIKVGNGRSRITPTGLNGNMPVYLATWEQTYTVDADISEADILSSIESTGASIHYM